VDDGLRRRVDIDMLEVEQIALGSGENPLHPVVPIAAETLRHPVPVVDDSDAPPDRSNVERVSRLPNVPENEVPLAERASGQDLHGIDAASIVLHDRDDLLVRRSLGVQRPEGGLCHPVSDRQPRTTMAVESDDLLESSLVHCVPMIGRPPPHRKPDGEDPKMPVGSENHRSDKEARLKNLDADVRSEPPARRSNHVDILHGTAIPDPYRWMEEIDTPEVRDWIEGQNARTEEWLARTPQDRIRRRLEQLSAFERIGPPKEAGGRLFFTVHDGIQPQPILVWSLNEGTAAERSILVDPNGLSDDGTVALTDFEPSPDGRFVIYGLSEAGSDWQVWRVRSVETGDDLADELRWTKFALPTWTSDGASVFYVRQRPPVPGTELRTLDTRRSVYRHRIGTSQSDDDLVFERPDEPIWLYGPRITEDGRYLVVTVQPGTYRKNGVFLLDLTDPTGQPIWLFERFDAAYEFIGSRGTRFFFLTDQNAPRGRIIRVDGISQASDEIVPEAADILQTARVVGGRIIASYLQHAASELILYRLTGEPVAAPALPGLGTIAEITGRGDGSSAYVLYTDVARPPTVLRCRVADGAISPMRRTEFPFDPTGIAVDRLFVTASDGTRIPVFISRQADVAPGPETPMVLYGYGGFHHALSPAFRLAHFAWLDLGGVLAVACIRGGGEYGREWHEAGVRERRPTVFSDFIDVAEQLIDRGLAGTSRLAIHGVSGGGLLVGACMTKRPELFGAALPAVGVLDMLRFHRFTVGGYWVSDYGSPDDPEIFPILLNDSPYHNVRPGTTYPPTLVLTADHDDRVHPAHSFKFAAALQHAQAGDAPILARIETRAGHGLGKPTDKVLNEAADMWAFLVGVFGIPVDPVD